MRTTVLTTNRPAWWRHKAGMAVLRFSLDTRNKMGFNLKDIIDVDRSNAGVWIQFKHTTFEVLVTYYGRPAMRELSERCSIKEYDTRQMKAVERLDNDLFRKEYVKRVIKDWRGLTLTVLKQLVVVNLDPSLPADLQVDCTEDNKEMLVTQSLEFDAWLQQMCSDVENFNRAQKVVEEKN